MIAPVPWKVLEFAEGGKPESVTFCLIDEQGNNVAEHTAFGQDNICVSRQTFNLLSAAPELIKGFKSLISAVDSGLATKVEARRLAAITASAKSALEKATGKA